MNTITLENLLKGQDLSPFKVCEQVLNDSFDRSGDPLTAHIIDIWENNEQGKDLDSMVTDFDYAISQLNTARLNVINANKV